MFEIDDEKIAQLVEALESIASLKTLPEDCEGYLQGLDKEDLIECIVNDTNLARQVLKECGE